MTSKIGTGLLISLFLASASPQAARAQTMDDMFEANLLVGYGSSDSYAFGFGARVGAWLTALGERPIGLIVGARGAWHSGNPTVEFRQFGGNTVRTEVVRQVSYGALELGPAWFYGPNERFRVRTYGLIGAGFVRGKATVGSPPFVTQESPSEARFLFGPGLDVNLRVGGFTVGGELIVIPMSEVDTVLIYGHIGGLWNG